MKNILLFLFSITIALISCNKEPETPQEPDKSLDIKASMSGDKENFRTSYDIQIHSPIKESQDYYLTVMAVEETFTNTINDGVGYETRMTSRFDGDLGIEWKIVSYFNDRTRNDSVIGIPVYAKKMSLAENMVLNERLNLTFPSLSFDPEFVRFKLISVIFTLFPASEEFEKLFLDNSINGTVIFPDTTNHRHLMRDYANFKEQFPENPVRALIISNQNLRNFEYSWINGFFRGNVKSFGNVLATSLLMPMPPIDYPAFSKVYCYEEDKNGNMKLLE